MKRAILLFTLLLSSLALQAQPPQRGDRVDGATPQEFQTKLMVKQLELNEQQGEKFSALYTKYTTDLSSLRQRGGEAPGGRRGGGGAGENREQLTDAQIEAQILESFEMTEKSTALKRDYYTKFKEILTPHQIMRMYTIEREFNERLNAEHQRRMGNKQEPRGRESQK